MDDNEIRQKIHNWLTLENVTGFMQYVLDRNTLQCIAIRRVFHEIICYGTDLNVKTIYMRFYLIFARYLNNENDYLNALRELYIALCQYPHFANYQTINNTHNPNDEIIRYTRRNHHEQYQPYIGSIFEQFFNEKNTRLLCNDYFNNAGQCNRQFEIAICSMMRCYPISALSNRQYDLYSLYRYENEPNFYRAFYKYLSYNNPIDIHKLFLLFDRYHVFIHYHHLLKLRKRVLLIHEDIIKNYKPKNITYQLLANEYIVMNILAF
jgi:hypothetical protein